MAQAALGWRCRAGSPCPWGAEGDPQDIGGLPGQPPSPSGGPGAAASPRHPPAGGEGSGGREQEHSSAHGLFFPVGAGEGEVGRAQRHGCPPSRPPPPPPPAAHGKQKLSLLLRRVPPAAPRRLPGRTPRRFAAEGCGSARPAAVACAPLPRAMRNNPLLEHPLLL